MFLPALIDSGAAGNFIDATLATKYGIPLQKIEPPLTVNALDGRPTGTGQVTHQTMPLTLKVGAFHHETMQLLVINSPHDQLVLGYPWHILE